MNFKSSLLLPVLVLMLSACGSKNNDSQKPAKNPSTPTTVENKPANPDLEPAKAATAETHILKITALNFLRGESESCDVTNKNFSFTNLDKNVKVPICKNLMVTVYAVSDSGTVVFHATDRLTGRELPMPDGSNDQSYELGKARPMLRYSPENPYGFTHVMVDEVTGIDPQLLAQWNELNGRYANLKAQVLTAQRDGTVVPNSVLEELKAVEAEMSILAQEMEKSRQQ